MKRTKTLKRTPLKRGTKELKARKADPSKRRFAKLRNPEYVAWIRQQICAIPATSTWIPDWSMRAAIHVCHVKSRAAGGADIANVVPMCATHHDEQHRIGILSFQRKYGVDLKRIATDLWASWEREQGVTLWSATTAIAKN